MTYVYTQITDLIYHTFP